MEQHFFTKEKRDDLLKKYVELEIESEKNPDAQNSKVVASIFEKYRNGLPILPLSRCPYSDEEWAHSIDYYGIDGLWWREARSIRPLSSHEKFGGKYICHTGSIALRKPFEYTHWRSLVGPDRPFVLTRLLDGEFPEVKAVLSHLKVGDFDAYLVVYFGNKKYGDYMGREYRFIDLPNDWASGEHMTSPIFEDDGSSRILNGFNPVISQDYDFDLTPWIEKEQLLWIEKGDKSLTIKKGTTGCPYLDLPSEHNFFSVKKGDWYPQPIKFKKWKKQDDSSNQPVVKHKKRKLKKLKKKR